MASAELKFCYLEPLAQNCHSFLCLSNLGQVLRGQKCVMAAETDVPRKSIAALTVIPRLFSVQIKLFMHSYA